MNHHQRALSLINLRPVSSLRVLLEDFNLLLIHFALCLLFQVVHASEAEVRQFDFLLFPRRLSARNDLTFDFDSTREGSCWLIGLLSTRDLRLEFDVILQCVLLETRTSVLCCCRLRRNRLSTLLKFGREEIVTKFW